MTLSVVALLGLVLFGGTFPEAEAANASETCLGDVLAALQADSPRAFDSDAILEGPKTVEMVERELEHQYPELEEFKHLMRPGDCLMFFRSNPRSWSHAYGSEGYVLVRKGRIIRILATKIQ